MNQETFKDYNTTRGKLIIPEYGRNVQNMVEFALSVADQDERLKVATAIVSVMENLNKNYSHSDADKDKLWVHLWIISDFRLDIDYPIELPPKEEVAKKPAPLAYTQGKIRNGHYGKMLEQMIEEGKKMEDEGMRAAFALTIANLMKRFYLTYNRDSVEDEFIKNQLKQLSGAKLIVAEDEALIPTGTILKGMTSSSNSYKSKKKKPNNNHQHKRPQGANHKRRNHRN